MDDGYIGANFNHPGFQQMIADMENGEMGCVIIKDLSRLGRNQLHTGLYIEERFPMLGIRYIAINDNVDTENPLSAKRALDLVRENQQSSAHNFVKDFSSIFQKSSRRSPLEKGTVTEIPLEYGKAEVQTLCHPRFHPCCVLRILRIKNCRTR